MLTRIIVVLLSASLFFTSCTHHTHSSSSKIPPGQAKKMTGSKSAKPYAPGQQKKH